MKAAAAEKRVRAFVRGLPEAVEGEHGHREAYRVSRKLFLVFEVDEGAVLVHVTADDRQALATADGFEEIIHGSGRLVQEWMKVSLASVDVDHLCEVIEDGWRRYATKRALAARDA